MTALTTVSGGLASDIITWVRRLIKSTSSQSISDQTIGDYINRFYTYDMPERLQLFELRRQYVFEAIPNISIYQFPYQNYQILRPPCYVDGVEMGFFNDDTQFYRVYPELPQNIQPFNGNGTKTGYDITLSSVPILRGFTDDLGTLLPYVFITAIDDTGDMLYIVDDGFGNLIETDATFQVGPFPNQAVNPPLAAGSVDYATGALSDVTFSQDIPSENVITIQTFPYSAGRPRVMLFYNNQIKLYPVPDRPYLVKIDSQITPAQFLSTASAVPFAYMAEYLSLGAARKILSDDGDEQQLNFYEPRFREQENLVLRRTSRQMQVTRTPTIFSTQTSSMNNPYIFTQ